MITFLGSAKPSRLSRLSRRGLFSGLWIVVGGAVLCCEWLFLLSVVFLWLFLCFFQQDGYNLFGLGASGGADGGKPFCLGASGGADGGNPFCLTG